MFNLNRNRIVFLGLMHAHCENFTIFPVDSYYDITLVFHGRNNITKCDITSMLTGNKVDLQEERRELIHIQQFDINKPCTTFGVWTLISFFRKLDCRQTAII